MTAVPVGATIQTWCEKHKAEAEARGLNLSAMGALMIEPVFAQILDAADGPESAAALFVEAADTPMCCLLSDADREEIMSKTPLSGGKDLDEFVATKYMPGKRLDDNN